MLLHRTEIRVAKVWWRDREGHEHALHGENIFQALFEARYRGATWADGRTSEGNEVSFILRDGVWRRRVDS